MLRGSSGRDTSKDGGLKLPFQCFFSIGGSLEPVDDIIEVSHFLVASLSASVEFGALEGRDLVSVQAVIGAC